MKQVKLLQCPHEGCEEQHLLTPDQFKVVRGKMGEKSKSSVTGIKITAEDAKAAKLVKQRDRYQCRRCGCRPAPQGLHAAHIFSRRYKATRTVLDNIVSLCMPCHRWAHDHPESFYAWVKSWMGEEAFDALQQLSQTTVKKARKTA